MARKGGENFKGEYFISMISLFRTNGDMYTFKEEFFNVFGEYFSFFPLRWAYAPKTFYSFREKSTAIIKGKEVFRRLINFYFYCGGLILFFLLVSGFVVRCTCMRRKRRNHVAVLSSLKLCPFDGLSL